MGTNLNGRQTMGMKRASDARLRWLVKAAANKEVRQYAYGELRFRRRRGTRK